MKRKISKGIFYLVTLCVITAATFMCANAAKVTSNGLVYQTSGSSATLVKCNTNPASVTVPSKVGKYKVTTIGEKAFYGKNKIKTVTLPSSVTAIKKSAFYKCTSLSSITIPSSVKKIEASAFAYCTALKTFTLPKTVSSIGSNIFKECKNLTVYVYAGSSGESYIKKYSNINMVYRYMTSVKLNKTSISLNPAGSFTLKATASPAKLYNSAVTFSSSDTSVATVSATGAVTAVDCGNAVITCTAKDGSGKKATCLVKVYPTKVTGLKATNPTATGYTLSWTAVKGADGYIISRYDNSSKSWSNVAYVSSASYKFTNVALGSGNSYRVIAYANAGNKKLYGSASGSVYACAAKPSKVNGLKVNSVDEKSVSLSWSAAANTTGYKIYLYDSSTGKYTYKCAASGTSAVIGNLQSNKSYTFAVRSYVRTVKAALDCTEYSSAVTAVTLPGKVTGVEADSKLIYTDRLTLNWDSVDGATGYNVYMYNKHSKSYELYKTVSGTSVEINGLETDTSYNFKVRAYKQNGDKKTESAWSDMLTVKTAYVPHTPVQSAQSFVSAYAALKTPLERQTVISNLSAKDVEEVYDEDFEAVIGDITSRKNGYYTFTDGREDNSGKLLGELVYPCNSENRLTIRDILTDTLTFEEDGFGYSISFDVDSKKVFEIAEKPDFEKVEKENEGFILNSFKAENGKVSVKIIDGKISSLMLKVPVSITFSLNGESCTFSYTLSQNYSFN